MKAVRWAGAIPSTRARRSSIGRPSTTSFANAGFTGDIGLISIDVDGIDYWIWDAIDVVSPRIVVIEFNSVFGCDHPVTVPYDPAFDCTVAHSSRLYFGASLPALVALGKRKGYRFVGCESHGANAFFVRDDVGRKLPRRTARDGYVSSRFRSSATRREASRSSGRTTSSCG